MLLSGPVGAGKTTISAELVAITPAPVACIEGDKFWPFFAKPPPDQTRHELFRISMRAMTAAALPFAREGYETIIDFSIPPGFLPHARAIAATRGGVRLHYVIILPSQSVCAARAAARREGRIENYDEYSDFYQSFRDWDHYTIPADEGTPAEIAHKIRAALTANAYLLP